ncbi:ABC transporter permease [Catellatospora chokoriensis]|uniref:ABC-2 type transporter transmembrane domain-containing protein n=2 Tax=Catellatospora chokoriensis TaxID=310353 RepID=A0A8J3JVJ7_9ACTN|nr:ABC transporter permease [Catellatospora chokoriensis]GIF87667.1 hypothetical protein Cch02nite_11110 [Catellatospora chokoriensis]
MTLAPWRVARAAAVAGYQEFRSLFSLRAWLGGYVVRLLFQVIFFSMVGKYVGGPGLVQYLLVGNVLAIIAMQGVAHAQSAAAERTSGFLLPLVGSPADHVVTLLARNAIRLVLSLASGIIVLTVLVIAFGLPLPLPGVLFVPPVLLAVAISCYCFGCFLAALVYRFEGLRQVASNAAYLTVAVFAGVNVPISYWPRPLQVFSEILPVTHGLRALRALLGQVPQAAPGGQVAWELLVGTGWMLAAGVLLRWWIDADRASGRLDLA